MRRAAALLLAAAACGRCADQAPDAGAAAVADAGRPAQYSGTDLRTALFTMFPEFRGTRVLEGRAELTRRIEYSGAGFDAELEPLAAARGFKGYDAGFGRLDRFELRASPAALTIRMALGDDDIPKLLQTPAPITSEQMAFYLPALPSARVLSELFTLDVVYEAKPERAAFLCQQVVALLGSSEWRVRAFPEGWHADGGPDSIPARFELVLDRSHAGSEIRVARDGGRVALTFVQPLR